MTSPSAAAFFDFDRTVHDGDAGVLFAQKMLRLRRSAARGGARGTLDWLVRNAAFEAWFGRLMAEAVLLRLGSGLGVVKRSAMLKRAYQRTSGLRIDDLRAAAQEFVEEVAVHRLYPHARREMERHRKEGRRVVVVSTGMRLVIDPVRRHLPVDDVIAVDLAAAGGVLTGQADGPLWGAEKADAVQRYAQQNNLSLAWSYAYSDHRSDLPFLRLVGHPVAVNPDFPLAWNARRWGWPILRWRLPGAPPVRGASSALQA